MPTLEPSRYSASILYRNPDFPMSTPDATTQLLREIRDLQQQHLDEYRNAAQRSLALQEQAVERQQHVVKLYIRALIAGGVLVAFILALIVYLMRLL